MATQRRGRVVVISGPSGVGKSTICARLCEQIPGEFSVSWTTRPPRPGERDGVNYHFVDDATFESHRTVGGFAEIAEVYGRRYGTPVEPVRQALAAGRSIILEIDITGAVQVRRVFPEAMMIYVLPPNPQEQARRIITRRTDDEAEIAKRLARADGEIRYAQEAGVYNHFVINDDLDATVAKIKAWIKDGG